jgi:predicted permease
VQHLLSDLKFGLRMLIKQAGTSALAIAALALGIGLTTTMFSIVDAAFLRGLPFDHAERIVALSRERLNGGLGNQSGTPHDFVDWRAAQHSFEDLAATSPFPANVSSAGEFAERYRAAAITPNTLRVLRVQPATGRDFADADGQPGAPAVVLISHAIWLGKFKSDPAAIGRTIRINGEVSTIVGVMPPRFGFPQTADLWVPLKLELPAKRGEGRFLAVFGRLKPEASLASSQADLKTIARQLAQQYPENAGFSASVQPYVRRFIGPQIIAVLSTMLLAVFGVLLIACVNVTNLQLARAAERMKEMAVRLALGASRMRIVQQLLVEGLLLATAGAVLGVGLAAVGTRWFMRAIADTNPPFWINVRIDVRVLLFVTGLTLIAAIASSLVPALRIARQSVNNALKDETRSSTGVRVGAFSRVLVAAEMTLSFVLLVVSGLMIKSVVATSTIRFPFDTGVTTARVMIDERSYPSDVQVSQTVERLRDRMAAAPGMKNVAVSTDPPDGGGPVALTVQGEPPVDDAKRPRVRRVNISPEFFDVLNVRVEQGRSFQPSDREGGLLVTVVSADLARKFFPNGDAIGRRIQLGLEADRPWRTVVGIVPSLNVTTALEDTTDTAFVPIAQSRSRDVFLFASASGATADLGQTMRRAARDVDPNLPLYNVDTLKAQYDQRSWPYRVFGALFMTFGLAALVMAAAGLYGVIAFGVRRRTQEIGVRMALGAGRPAIIQMILRQAVWQIVIGVGVGFGLGGLLGSSLKLLLFQVSAWDPLVFGGTILVLAGTALVASLIPALRAASIDPLKALRTE